MIIYVYPIISQYVYVQNSEYILCLNYICHEHLSYLSQFHVENPSSIRGQLEPTTGPLNWFFQWAFCSAAATIVSGGVAERVAFGPYVVFSFLMTAARR